jgi:electron transfer flavoprotein beta subunit
MMPKILVCYKWVLDEQDIKINANDRTLDISRAKYKISDYDKNAVEEASLLVEKLGGTVEALTFGTNTVKNSLKDLLSRGPDRAFYIGDPLAEKADAFVTANILAAAAKKIGEYDLIICGEGSADAYNQQVAPRLAALLEIPAITYVRQLAVEGSRIVATRKLGNCTEVVTVEGPAVISVLPELNKPRIPSLKQVLGASKKPSSEIKVTELGLAQEELMPKVISLSVKGFVMNRKTNIYKESNQADNIDKLIASLAKEGLC